MKVTKVYVNYGVTRNMGNYESLRLDYGMEISVDPLHEQEALKQGKDFLREQITAAVKEEIEFLHGANKPQRRG